MSFGSDMALAAAEQDIGCGCVAIAVLMGCGGVIALAFMAAVALVLKVLG